MAAWTGGHSAPRWCVLQHFPTASPNFDSRTVNLGGYVRHLEGWADSMHDKNDGCFQHTHGIDMYGPLWRQRRVGITPHALALYSRARRYSLPLIHHCIHEGVENKLNPELFACMLSTTPLRACGERHVCLCKMLHSWPWQPDKQQWQVFMILEKIAKLAFAIIAHYAKTAPYQAPALN